MLVIPILEMYNIVNGRTAVRIFAAVLFQTLKRIYVRKNAMK